MTTTAPHILSKKTSLYIILSGFFLTNALIAEIIGVKIFSLEASLGFSPAQLSIFGLGPFNFEHTAGVILWPFVFVTTDIINEYYGKEGVRRITFITAGFISYAFVMIWLATKLVPASFWVGLYPNLNIENAYDAIFGQTMNIIVASIIAFIIGQLVDMYVFHTIRHKTGGKMMWLRATGSTVVSQLIDTFVVLYLAFYLFSSNPWSMQMILAVSVMNYLLKFVIAAALTPLLYVAHYVIDRYLGDELSEKMIEEADANY